MLQCRVLPSEYPCWLIFGVSSPEISGLRLHHHEAPCNHKAAITTKHNAKTNSSQKENNQSMLECHVLKSENPCWLFFGVSSPEISGLRLHHHAAITTKHNAKTNSKARKEAHIHVAMPLLAIRKSMLANFWSIFTRDQRITTTPSCCNNNKTQHQNKFKSQKGSTNPCCNAIACHQKIHAG